MFPMQATRGSRETGGGNTARRGHVPHLSISDESHHVTETIGYMYEDDYDRRDSRHLSYMSSPPNETFSAPSSSGGELESPIRLHQREGPPAGTDADDTAQLPNGPSLGPSDSSTVGNSENGSPSTFNPSPTEPATSAFPHNDIDYESNPAAVAQELSNLAAIRRMSLDVTGDPDLPSFNFQAPSMPASSTDENDASRLFWVPARLHPELAPKEFKTFLESKADQIQRRSSDASTGSGVERQGSAGGLRRKRSMLSRQIDNPNGYTDGAERLERKRSENRRRRQELLNPDAQDLEAVVEDPKQLNKEALSLLQGVEALDIAASEDKPILPPAPPGGSLRRSTRTQYRKGSLKKGERLPYSKRMGKTSGESSSAVISADEPPPLPKLTRVATDPTPTTSKPSQKPSGPIKSLVLPLGTTPTSSTDPVLEPKESSQPVDMSPQPRPWQSRISSNGRSTVQIPPSAQKVPQIIETPPDDSRVSAGSSVQRGNIPERTSSHQAPPTWTSQISTSPETNGGRPKRPPFPKQLANHSPPTIADITSHQSPIPGNTTRTDSLSFIPTLPEDKKPEGKRPKEKKDAEGTRKSSWHWLLGSEEKEKDKKKDKDSESKKSKSKQTMSMEKAHDRHENARLDVLQTSIDGGQRGRESLVLDRAESKLEEERRKESAKKLSGEVKKDKETGLLSSLFGGKKKSSGDGHKKHSRNLSPEIPARDLRPDVDYHWTRFSILEERAIYRMAHIKLANPRRPLYSQVLLSNFMYSYLAKVQQMHPQMMLPSSAAQQKQEKNKDQPDEFTQYQRYQETQQYGDGSHDVPEMFDPDSDDRLDRHRPKLKGSNQSLENGMAYGSGTRQSYGAAYSSIGDAAQLGDEDDMW